ncbi:glutamine-dependent NAD(+) synthetase [Mycoemilia scoparia]|uniref:Glutamine-dependent NAD(+) synthetase n=1 Tax=Mycoemilia scoparia TaxID=417184 RepID=A0A9W8DWN0_9FUNG|nr:glutamine-dependent NAD(+) synthetase [Mycoemilia scoparia]
MSYPVTVATCALNQWALDFDGNYDRICQSIIESKRRGATLRVGSELEIPGYGCYDHFLENDTALHSWQVLVKLLSNKDLHDILIDTGMPVIHKNNRYNCRVFILNGKVIFIRPKLYMANDGNYRELRWFRPWEKRLQVEKFILPKIVQDITNQTTVMFGDALIDTADTCIGVELCEELFTPESPHIAMSLDGAEIILNSSGSHHELRKLSRRIELIREATLKSGGVYLYANQQGCDGDRLYYDGSAMVLCNGDVLAIGKQFSVKDVDVVVATVDLDDVRVFRTSKSSRGIQASNSSSYPRIETPFSLGNPKLQNSLPLICPTPPKAQLGLHTPEQEINLGPACWLWDYLRRSGTGGFFLPLSGGIDSCATAMIVYSMCNLVVEATQSGDEQVISDVRRVTETPESENYIPSDPRELANRIFHTCYLGTSNSGTETRERAKALAEAIGSYHTDLNMDTVVESILSLFKLVTGKQPKYQVYGGSATENLALQNIQARLRMLLSYLFASLLSWVRGRSKSLLVLGSANVDECLRGYLTKYDCSSADINPIGGISKTDLRSYIQYSSKHFSFLCLEDFLNATPTAELVPTTEGYVQSDEIEMGMTYSELSAFGRLRKVGMCGPYYMFRKLACKWGGYYTPAEIAQKVKRFFFYYSINRHKMTTITPAYHAESYSPDDNRFDLRPFLYNAKWTMQFREIDEAVKNYTLTDQVSTLQPAF